MANGNNRRDFRPLPSNVDVPMTSIPPLPSLPSPDTINPMALPIAPSDSSALGIPGWPDMPRHDLDTESIMEAGKQLTKLLAKQRRDREAKKRAEAWAQEHPPLERPPFQERTPEKTPTGMRQYKGKIHLYEPGQRPQIQQAPPATPATPIRPTPQTGTRSMAPSPVELPKGLTSRTPF